jgi:DNA-binding ferritin-like protein
MTSKSLRKNKTLIYSIPIQLAFQIAFFHWNIHGKKFYIYTI